MKTSQHIETLKSLGVFEAFERNLKSGLLKKTIQEYIDYWKVKGHITFKEFVFGAFYWEDTPEGHKFWSNIAENNTTIKQHEPTRNKIGS